VAILLKTIGSYSIGGYSIGKYWWLLMAIGGYCIISYC
jgi:hypothetical protein